MLFNAIHDPDIKDTLPNTIAALTEWDGKSVPDEATFEALAHDLKQAHKDKTIALLGKRMNYEISGIRSKVIATGRKLDKVEQGPWKEAVLAADPAWGDVWTWAVIKRGSSAYTPYYLLSMLDLRQDVDGSIVKVSRGPRHLCRYPAAHHRHQRCW